jgi:hypothetical protein
MSTPDFDRAEYVEPDVIDGNTGFVVGSPRASNAALPLALVYGVGAAIVGAIGYAIIGLSGFMVSIVTIGIGWLVAKAMMTATKGVGGRQYQIAAVALTYLSASCGEILDDVWHIVHSGGQISHFVTPALIPAILFAPFLDLVHNLGWGVLGLLILFYGLRTAWQMAAGAPGFGQPGGPRVGAMGLR